MLNKIENKFNNSNPKTMIELSIIVLILFIVSVLYIKDMRFYEVHKEKTKSYKGDIYEIYSQIKRIENIKILNSSVSKRDIEFEINSSLNHIMYVLNEIENINDFIKIEHYEVLKLEDKYKLDVKVSIDKYTQKKELYRVEYIKKSVKENETSNIIKLNEKIKLNEPTTFILNAIVFNHALINNNLLKINQKLDGYKLIEIKTNSVKLSFQEKTIEVFLDE